MNPDGFEEAPSQSRVGEIRSSLEKKVGGRGDVPADGLDKTEGEQLLVADEFLPVQPAFRGDQIAAQSALDGDHARAACERDGVVAQEPAGDNPVDGVEVTRPHRHTQGAQAVVGGFERGKLDAEVNHGEGRVRMMAPVSGKRRGLGRIISRGSGRPHFRAVEANPADGRSATSRVRIYQQPSLTCPYGVQVCGMVRKEMANDIPNDYSGR